MDKNTLIDQFIDKLVLNFNDNEVVTDIITKVNSMRGFKNIVVEDNTIKCITKTQTREIYVDAITKTIVFKDSGEKDSNNKREKFVNELRYVQKENKGNCFKNNVLYEMIDFKDKTILGKQTYSATFNYVDEKCVYSKVIKSNKKAIRDAKGQVSGLEDDNSKKECYVLANGDVLKIVNNDGKEKYFYCDNGIMDRFDNKKDYTKARFNVELSYNDAQNILKNLDDTFYLINNDTIFDIRGRSY